MVIRHRFKNAAANQVTAQSARPSNASLLGSFRERPTDPSANTSLTGQLGGHTESTRTEGSYDGDLSQLELKRGMTLRGNAVGMNISRSKVSAFQRSLGELG